MRTPNSPSAHSLNRWRTARSVVLGSIILAGSMATSAALMFRVANTTCAQKRQVERGYTYSGIGAVIQQRGEHVFVRQVITDGPADGLLHEGAILVAVDGVYPGSVEAFADALRGPAGTTVQVELAYPCSSSHGPTHETVVIERSVIRVRR